MRNPTAAPLDHAEQLAAHQAREAECLANFLRTVLRGDVVAHAQGTASVRLKSRRRRKPASAR